MRDFAGRPTIIDALTGPVPPAACQALPALARAVTDAAAWSRTGQRPVHDPFGGVNDADL